MLFGLLEAAKGLGPKGWGLRKAAAHVLKE